ncbi:hypothetical protein Bhyg_03493, partial [Pseudolycoriella hygida]
MPIALLLAIGYLTPGANRLFLVCTNVRLQEGSVSLIYGSITLFILVNSCQSSSLQMKYLIQSIELYAFWTSDNMELHCLKQEIFSQINYLPIYVSGSGFFTIDRQYLAG